MEDMAVFMVAEDTLFAREREIFEWDRFGVLLMPFFRKWQNLPELPYRLPSQGS
jgi:hypothetical protein